METSEVILISQPDRQLNSTGLISRLTSKSSPCSLTCQLKSEAGGAMKRMSCTCKGSKDVLHAAMFIPCVQSHEVFVWVVCSDACSVSPVVVLLLATWLQTAVPIDKEKQDTSMLLPDWAYTHVLQLPVASTSSISEDGLPATGCGS